MVFLLVYLSKLCFFVNDYQVPYQGIRFLHQHHIVWLIFPLSNLKFGNVLRCWSAHDKTLAHQKLCICDQVIGLFLILVWLKQSIFRSFPGQDIIPFQKKCQVGFIYGSNYNYRYLFGIELLYKHPINTHPVEIFFLLLGPLMSFMLRYRKPWNGWCIWTSFSKATAKKYN